LSKLRSVFPSVPDATPASARRQTFLAPSWHVPDGDIHGTRRRADSGMRVKARLPR